METIDINKDYFTTSDTALAGYLYYKGMHAIEATIVDRKDPRRKQFIFVDDNKREQYEDEFFKREAEVIPLEYWEACRDIKRYLRTTVEYPR